MSSTIPFDAYKGTDPFIFVSYAHKDRDHVFPLIQDLYEQGYRIWYDEGIDPGNEWPDEIAHALESASQFLVFVSPHAVASRNVRNEINLALGSDKKFIAIHLVETQLPSGLKLSMGSIQAIFKWRMSDEHFSRKLAGSLSPALKTTTVTAPASRPEASTPVALTEPRVPTPAVRSVVDGRVTSGAPQAWTVKPEPSSLRVPAGCRAAAGTAALTGPLSGWAQEIVHVTTGMAFCFIPPGVFNMGSPAGEVGRFADEVQHRVTLTHGFYLGKCPVTQAQWERVMGANPSHFKGADLPVETVSWDDCQTFLRKFGSGARLPTEAEWEYACRAGTTTALNNGTALTSVKGPCPNLDAVAWYDQNSRGTTHPVGLKQPNGWGLHDMHGNVWEWCSDRCGEYPTGGVTNPQGAQDGTNRMGRGGSWVSYANYCRVAYRINNAPAYRDNVYGLRAILPPGQP